MVAGTKKVGFSDTYSDTVVLLYKTGFDREADENFKSYLVYLKS